jgi:hypothetical protein
VITLPPGDHAQALAWAATQSGISSTVVRPAASVLSGGNVDRERLKELL